MKNFNTFSIALIMLVLTGQSLMAQNLTVIKHDLSNFHDNPTSTYFAEDSEGNIWALQWGGFTDDHVLKYDGATWTEVAFDECSNCTRRIIADNDGKIFLSTTQAIYSWNGGGWDLETGSDTGDSDIDFDSDNTLWFYDPNDDELNEYKNGLTQFYSQVSGSVMELTVAEDDRVWMRIDGEVKYFQFSTLTSVPEFFSPLHIEAAGDGKVWVTNTFGQVGYYDNGTVELDVLGGIIDGGLAQTAFAIDEENDFFWFGQQGIEAGLVFYNRNTGITQFIDESEMFDDPFAPGLPSNAFVASDGTCWVGSNFIGGAAQIIPAISSIFEAGFEETSLFPNPATTIINMELELTSQAEFEVYIHDQLGRLIRTENVVPSGNTIQVNVEDLNAGQYFISLPSEQLYGRFVK